MFFVLFLFFNFIYLFLERGREGEREKHQCVVASRAPPTGVPVHNHGMCCDWESNLSPLVLSPALNPLSHTSQGSYTVFPVRMMLSFAKRVLCSALLPQWLVEVSEHHWAGTGKGSWPPALRLHHLDSWGLSSSSRWSFFSGSFTPCSVVCVYPQDVV